MKKNKKFTVIIVSIVGSILIYILSYSLLLPLFEKAYLGEVAYILYEPVEWIRTRNIFFWKIAEAGYKMCGGKVSPHKRVYFKNSPRRGILWHDNGQIKLDAFSKNLDATNIKSTFWYDNGIVHLKIEWYDNGNEKRRIERNKNGIIVNYGEFDKNGNGVIKWFDDNGKEVASATFKNCLTPVNGSVLLPPKQEGKKLVRHLLSYKNGKEVSRKIYFESDFTNAIGEHEVPSSDND